MTVQYAQDEKCRIGAHTPITEETEEGGSLLKPLSSVSYKQKVFHLISELRETAEVREKAKKLRP